MALSAFFALFLASLVSARVSCPTFFGAQDTSQLVYPTPGFKINYDNSTGEVTIVVNAVYDPFAALVIDFEPFVATRRSLSEFGRCENRDDNTTKRWSWRRANYSACIDDEDNVSYYPSSGHNWTRTDRDCNLVEYTYKSTLTDLVNNCGTTMMGWREVDGQRQFYGNVYVTYVRPDRDYDYECIIRVNDSDNCEVNTVFSQQQIAFYLTDVVKTTNTATCTDKGKIAVTSDVNWKTDGINLNVYTNVANPTDRGLLCSLESQCDSPSNLTFTSSKKECSCDTHCNTSAFCTSASTGGSCVQQWTLQSSGQHSPGCLNGTKYNLKWKVNNCKDYKTGSTCTYQPTASCSAAITVTENIKATYEYMDPIRPFAALLLRQPVNDRFDYSFSNSDLKVWVRVTPLVNTKANVMRIEYCEANDDGTNCNGSWTTIKSWNDGAISANQYVEASTVISDPRNKVFLFRAITDNTNKGVTTLVLDTHNGNNNRIAPIPTTYVGVDRTYCDGNYDGDPDDGFSLEGIDIKRIAKLAGAILTTIAMA